MLKFGDNIISDNQNAKAKKRIVLWNQLLFNATDTFTAVSKHTHIKEQIHKPTLGK